MTEEPLEFTGERFVPGKSLPYMEDDHLERYKFAGNYANGKWVLDVLDIAWGTGYGTHLL